MANQPLIFALLGSGGILLISAVTGSSVADVLKGHPGKVSHTGQTLSVAGMSSAASTAVGGGGKSPFPGGFTPGRLDQGYDGTVHGSSITAPLSGTITFASSSFSNWGGYVQLKSDAGKIAGLPTDTLYFAEGLAPTVHAGQHVNAGDQIARTARSPFNGITGNIEWGPAKPGSVGTPSDPLQQGGQDVLAFARWAESSLGLPSPSSTLQAGMF